MQTVEQALAAIQASLAELHTKIDSLINKQPEVEPCPVCTDGAPIIIQLDNGGRSCYLCRKCAEKHVIGNNHWGPSTPTPQEALVAWNKKSRELRGLKP